MDFIAKSIMVNRTVTDGTGQTISLHSHTSLEQCAFIQRLIEGIGARRCLEIGLAYGVSSLFICEAIATQQDPKFISIDPFQDRWRNIGVLNLERAGYSGFVEFHRSPSHEVLPQLIARRESIDFAYVDTSKVFDVVLLDAFYLTRLLRVGGLLCLDDCVWPGVKRVVRYLATWPHLRVVGRHGEKRPGRGRRVASWVANRFPKKDRIFAQDLLSLDSALGVQSNCVAFEKVAEDERKWDWFAPF